MSQEAYDNINEFRIPEWLKIESNERLPKSVKKVLEIMLHITEAPAVESKVVTNDEGENENKLDLSTTSQAQKLIEALAYYKTLIKTQGPKLNPDSESILKAFRFATAFDVYNARHIRDDESLYLGHLVGVHLLSKYFGGSFEAIIAAFLHDTYEDTHASKMNFGQSWKIEDSFGENVAGIVRNLTFGEIQGESRDAKVSRKIIAYSEFDQQTALVKFCDLLFNMLTKDSASPRYIKERIAMLEVLGPKLPEQCKEVFDFFYNRIIELNKKGE
jgi:hypothetical protein